MARTRNKRIGKGRHLQESKKKSASQSALAPPRPMGQVYGDYFAECTLRALMFSVDEKSDIVSKVVLTDLLKTMAPRDPLERMLVEQLAWTHERVGRLSKWAAGASSLKGAMAAHNHCERASNTFRKGMLTLKEYRAQPRETPLVAVQQVNNAAGGYTRIETVPVEHRAEAVPLENEKKQETQNELGANYGDGTADSGQ